MKPGDLVLPVKDKMRSWDCKTMEPWVVLEVVWVNQYLRNVKCLGTNGTTVFLLEHHFEVIQSYE